MSTIDAPTGPVVTEAGDDATTKQDVAAPATPGAGLSDRDLARRVAEANYLLSMFKDAEAAIRAEQLRRMQEDYTKNGNASRKVFTEDNRLVGTATLNIPKDKVSVTNETTLTDWLQMEYEDAAVETRAVIIDGFRSTYLSKGVLAQRNVPIVTATQTVLEDVAVVDGQVINPETGEVIEGTEVLALAVVDPKKMKVVPGMTVDVAAEVPPSFTMRFEPRPKGAKAGGGKDLMADALAERVTGDFTPRAILMPAPGGAQ